MANLDDFIEDFEVFCDAFKKIYKTAESCQHCHVFERTSTSEHINLYKIAINHLGEIKWRVDYMILGCRP